ncbi:hypothetical protein [Pelomonas cellulosilytica]|uniref:Transmembrane protein n=1 Tax=Pelomonas cellulosilytica TaxID=2906762 RepID=A0ABS8XST8_9BURK|nr:hypothetical protein [Pelomonas sp. P8]MCE4553739.1 hypothetical protein [Pelomonas sp. P8]
MIANLRIAFVGLLNHAARMRLSCAPSSKFGLSRMTSAVLKWIANGMIVLVVAVTLWIAQAVQPGDAGSMIVAQAVAAPAAGASAPEGH